MLIYDTITGEIRDDGYDPYYQPPQSVYTDTNSGARVVGMPQASPLEQGVGLIAGKGAQYVGEQALSGIGNALGLSSGAPAAVAPSLPAMIPGAESLAGSAAAYGSQLGSALLPNAGSLASNVGAYGSQLGSAMSGGSGVGGLSSLGAYLGPGATLALGAYVLSNMLDRQPRTKLAEEKRFAKLADRGVNVDPTKYQRRFRDDLAPDFVGKDKDGNFVNNKFFTSRNVKDLTADDLLGRPALYEMFGNADAGKMRRYADEALKAGLVDESLGAINMKRDARAAGLADALGLELQGSGQRNPIPLANRLSLLSGGLKNGLGGGGKGFDYGDEAWRHSREARMFGLDKSDSEGGPNAGADVARLDFLRSFDRDRAAAANEFRSAFGSDPLLDAATKPAQAATPKPLIDLTPGKLEAMPAIDLRNLGQLSANDNMEIGAPEAERLTQLLGGRL